MTFEQSPPQVAWLLLAVGENRQHGGNEGYDDQPDAYYSWDETVPNHDRPRVGDRVLLWNKQTSIGASMIEEITTAWEEKVLLRCPQCGKAGIKARRTRSPRFKCYKCLSEFEDPVPHVRHVQTYRARYDANWIPLDGSLSGEVLRGLSEAPKSQLSLRRMRWAGLMDFIHDPDIAMLVKTIDQRAASLAGGHVESRVRVRLGQEAFRTRLLRIYRTVCAITGSAPAEVLEAGHLYSYARVGEHQEHGGLLFRRDIHRLFDLGLLAINPGNLAIDVSQALAPHSQYTALQGRPLSVDVAPRQRVWIRRHWSQHR